MDTWSNIKWTLKTTGRGMAKGLKKFVDDGRKFIFEDIGCNPRNPISTLFFGAVYLVGGGMSKAGEALGEGVARMVTAKNGYDFAEGLSRALGGFGSGLLIGLGPVGGAVGEAAAPANVVVSATTRGAVEAVATQAVAVGGVAEGAVASTALTASGILFCNNNAAQYYDDIDPGDYSGPRPKGNGFKNGRKNGIKKNGKSKNVKNGIENGQFRDAARDFFKSRGINPTSSRAKDMSRGVHEYLNSFSRETKNHSFDDIIDTFETLFP